MTTYKIIKKGGIEITILKSTGTKWSSTFKRTVQSTTRYSASVDGTFTRQYTTQKEAVNRLINIINRRK